MQVPLLDLHRQYEPIKDEIKIEIAKLMEEHKYILGPKVAEFERKIEQFLGVKHAIGCASGSDALVLALIALGVGEGDEVITTPFTFFATAGSIHRVGAKPVFVDIEEDTFNIDPQKIEAAITTKTKAIMPVHLFGQMSKMDEIKAIADKHNIAIIEDNAQGIGSTYKSMMSGTVGDIGTLSFFPSKNLGAMGDAGLCMTNDDELAEKLRRLRVHGSTKKYQHRWVGYNSRLDSIHALVLSIKLDYLKKWTEQRRKNADYYNERLQNIPQIKTPFVMEGSQTIYNQYTLKAEKRDDLLAYLKSENIGCAIYYPIPLHLQDCFAYLNYKKGDFPITEKVSDMVISIPIFSELTEEEMDAVINAIKDFYKE